MADIIDHILSVLAALAAMLAVWLGRKATGKSARQTLESVVRDAVDYCKAHPQPGISDDRTALDAARLGDVRADGRRDFSDAQLIVAIRAELARRGL